MKRGEPICRFYPPWNIRQSVLRSVARSVEKKGAIQSCFANDEIMEGKITGMHLRMFSK